jgi:hypothetical protein
MEVRPFRGTMKGDSSASTSPLPGKVYSMDTRQPIRPPEGEPLSYYGFVFPSMSLLYDENAVTYGAGPHARPVGEVLTKMTQRDIAQPIEVPRAVHLHTALLKARQAALTVFSESSTARDNSLLSLYKHTWWTALTMSSDHLADSISTLITETYPDRQSRQRIFHALNNVSAEWEEQKRKAVAVTPPPSPLRSAHLTLVT